MFVSLGVEIGGVDEKDSESPVEKIALILPV